MICQQDPFIYGCKDFNNYAAAAMGIPDYGFCLADADADADEKPNPQILLDSNPSVGFWDSPPANSSSETVVDGFLSSPAAAAGRRKRRRAKSMKNKEEMENQRMTHIAVERNRRRQMNDYLAILRSLMPPSYAQRVIPSFHCSREFPWLYFLINILIPLIIVTVGILNYLSLFLLNRNLANYCMQIQIIYTTYVCTY